MMLRILPFEQEAHKNVCSDTLIAIEMNPHLLKRIVTCDESWFSSYSIHDNPCTGRVHPPRAKTARMSISKFTTMMIAFTDIHDIVYLYWFPEDQTINQLYYLQVLTELHERIRKKRPELWKLWVLHQDNALAHSAMSLSRGFLPSTAF
ncbi:putative mariner transposase [Trichonephila clavipes]|uniref:Putative mariner transposase n=1 Tax=Trichonephila clavipes TaxID=2585209 RepID=A0A8X6T5P3_TRICX|nr:putative mariner transposase [Trichonephila clavipes]